MQTVLTSILLASTLICAFNVWFYVGFWWRERSWGTALFALYPLVFLASRALELHKIEQALLGYSYVAPEEFRVAVGGIGLLVCMVQALAVIVRYDKLLKELKGRG